MALASAVTEVLWTRSFLSELGIGSKGPTKILEDNQSCIKLANNGSFSVKAKHIAIKYRFVHERIKERSILLQHCPSDRMIADIWTKSLSKVKFKIFRKNLMEDFLIEEE